MAVALFGIIFSLAFLVFFAYRGHSVVVVAPLAALIAAVFSGEPLMATYTQIFMPALADFVAQYFPLFLCGAIFGYLMTTTGLARQLAHGITALFGPKRALLSTVIATALLTYGGVSAWVVAFTVVPIAKALFHEAQIPKRLMPGAIALGTVTFALAALPGSPQIHNAIPTRYFGTNVYAAPVFGLVAALLMLIAGVLWLEYRVKQLRAKGEGIDEHTPDDDDEAALGATKVETRKDVAVQGLQGFAPIAVVIAVNFGVVFGAPRLWNTDYLATEKFGETNLDGVMGVWSPTIALATAIVVLILMFPSRVKKSVKEITEGAKNAILPCLTTASEVGFGAVVAATAVFALVKENMLGISDNALIVSIVSTAVISGITGSSSGGLSITMETLGTQLADLANAQNIDPEIMHRVTAMASVSFDSLPHNGAILTMLMVCGLTHRQSYKDIAVVTIIVPLSVMALMLGGWAIIGS